MKIGFDKMVGRFVVDIDGCLRSTDQRHVNVDMIIALHGGLDADVMVVWEINGESIPLSRVDWVELNDDMVGFFRSCAGSRFFRSAPARGLRRWMPKSDSVVLAA